jgi:predicted nucleotidyltransferase
MLFGSAAKGNLCADSDVDVAILPAEHDIALSDELALQAELTRVCERDVDLIRLDLAPTLVKWQVVRDGQVLLEQAPFAAARFIAITTAEYLDFAPALDRATEIFRRRLVASAGAPKVD